MTKINFFSTFIVCFDDAFSAWLLLRVILKITFINAKRHFILYEWQAVTIIRKTYLDYRMMVYFNICYSIRNFLSNEINVKGFRDHLASISIVLLVVFIVTSAVSELKRSYYKLYRTCCFADSLSGKLVTQDSPWIAAKAAMLYISRSFSSESYLIEAR